MSQRDSKKLTAPPRTRRRTTRRGLSPVVDRADPDGEPEPPFSNKPTRRDIALMLLGEPDPTQAPGPRGQYSISSVRGIPADTVAGTIEGGDQGRKRRRTAGPPPRVQDVHLAAASRDEITVIVHDQVITLERHNALALASIILTAFDAGAL